MQIEMHITKIGAVPGMKRFKSTLNHAQKFGYMSAVRHWHQRFLRMHFGNAASRRYGYTPRKGEPGSGVPFPGRKSPRTGRFQQSYTRRKLREKGHTRPLEFSGDLRRSTASYRIKGTKNTGECVLPRANKANFRHKDSFINMREELTTVRDDELAEMAKVAERDLIDDLNRARPREVKKITAGSFT